MASVIYVNFKTKEASYIPPRLLVKPIVGPILSRINGKLYFTADKTLDQIKDLVEQKYHQLQIEAQ